MKFVSVFVFIFVLGIAVAQAIFYFPMMPEPMAIHFGSNGEADGWASRNTFFALEFVILLIVVLSFIAMPWAFEHFKIKKSLNLPNKEYWTAPERIELVYEYFRNSFAWFGVITLIFLVGVLQLTFEANFLPKPILNLNIFLALFLGYLLFVTIWSIYFIRKFRKTE